MWVEVVVEFGVGSVERRKRNGEGRGGQGRK